MKSKPIVKIFPNLEGISAEAKKIFIETANNSINQRGRFLAALSGGNTPAKLYEQLSHEMLDWARIHFFWGDERCVPVEDAGNSYGQAKKILFDRINIPAENIHRVLSELEPDSAARRYAETLKDFSAPPLDWPRFDLTLLGMGDDGHTASLFPNSPVDMDSPVLAVTANYQDRPANRVTLTQNVINSSRNVLFLVTGESKAVTLSRVLSAIYMPSELPAQRIDPKDGRLIWLVDETAAGKL